MAQQRPYNYKCREIQDADFLTDEKGRVDYSCCEGHGNVCPTLFHSPVAGSIDRVDTIRSERRYGEFKAESYESFSSKGAPNVAIKILKKIIPQSIITRWSQIKTTNRPSIHLQI